MYMPIFSTQIAELDITIKPVNQEAWPDFFPGQFAALKASDGLWQIGKRENCTSAFEIIASKASITC